MLYNSHAYLSHCLLTLFPSINLFNNTVFLSLLNHTIGTFTLLCLITGIFFPYLHILETFSLSPLLAILSNIAWPKHLISLYHPPYCCFICLFIRIKAFFLFLFLSNAALCAKQLEKLAHSMYSINIYWTNKYTRLWERLWHTNMWVSLLQSIGQIWPPPVLRGNILLKYNHIPLFTNCLLSKAE